MMALQTSNTATETPFLRSPSPTPEPAKLSPSLKQQNSSSSQGPALQRVQQQDAQLRRQSPKHKKPGLSSRQRQNLVADSKRSATDCLVVVDDSKPDYRDISAAGACLQPVVLRPPFSLF
jgi:hypothetical protein